MSARFSALRRFLFSALFAVLALGGVSFAQAASVDLLNVSYDPTRQFYADFNDAFVKYWQQKTGQDLRIKQSHGGSGKQARGVIDGLRADVVTLALAGDIDVLASKAKLLPEDWQKRLPHNSSPYTSTIVFVVRKGNPQGVKDWDDLIKPGVSVITPNPKTSGGARWNYLAAYEYARRKYGSEDAAKAYISKLFANVRVLDTGARGATTTFVQRKIGDVLISWENEAYLILKEFGPDQVEIVAPSVSILAEPPVAVVDKVARKKGNEAVAKAYLEYLYSDEGQDIAGRNYYRPTSPAAAAKYASQFAKIELFSIDEAFGGWAKAQKVHFDDGGIFDQIYLSR